MLLTSWVLKSFSRGVVVKRILIQLENFGIPMCEVSDQFLQSFEARVASDGIVDVFDVRLDILLQLGRFDFVVSQEIRVHLDPFVPLQFPDPHGDVIRAMSKRPISLRALVIEIKVFQCLGQRRLKDCFFRRPRRP